MCIRDSGYTDDIEITRKQLMKIEQELKKLSKQLENTFDLVEQGVYSFEVFQNRRAKLVLSMEDLEAQKAELQKKVQRLEESQSSKASLIPQTEELLASYDHMTNQERNELLKEILERIEYFKGADGQIVIDLYPRLPKI